MRSAAADREPDVELNISAFSEADELYRAGRFLEALRLFSVSLEADPTDGDAFHAIGSCYDALHKPAQAAMAYRSAITLLPPERHPALHFNIGNAFFDNGKYEEALAEYRLVPAGDAVWPAASKNAKLALERFSNGG